MDEKIVRGWLIVDYKSGNMKIVKRLTRASASKATEIPIEISLKIEVPDKPILKAEGEIKLSQTQIANMVIESLSEGADIDGQTKL